MKGPVVTDAEICAGFMMAGLHIAQLRGEVAALRLVMENSMAGSLIETSEDPQAAAGDYFAGLGRQVGKIAPPDDADAHTKASYCAAEDAINRLRDAVMAQIQEHQGV